MEQIILTPKQQRFCDEYLIDMNATRAALRAGYSASTALNGQLMQLPKIAAYLQQRREAASAEAQITHQMVLAELGKIAFSNMANYYHPDGRLKGVHELTPDEAAALWCLKVTDGEAGQSAFIRLNNKLSALEKIARHLGFYEVEAEEPETKYVVIDKETLTADDRFEDTTYDKKEEKLWDEFAGETEKDRLLRMDKERRLLVHFHPRLDKLLPSATYLTDAMIKQALYEFTEEKSDEAWWIKDKRREGEREAFCREPEVLSGEDGGLRAEVPEGFENEGLSNLEEEKVAVAEAVAVEGGVGKGGVIDFGSSKKGTCQVPLMKGNSREYGYW